MITLKYFIILSFLIISLYLLEYDIIPSVSFTFVCKDPNLSYHFEGDTVTPKNLLISASVIPLLIIIIIEILREDSLKRIQFTNIWSIYMRCFKRCVIVLLITQFIKNIIKKPRPHFLDVCRPDSNETCEEGSLIAEYVCTNTQLSRFQKTELTRSFPSGHASLSVFASVYCTYLIITNISSNPKRIMIKSSLIIFCLSWSCLCSISRVTDHQHHWWDVLAGAALGLCCALYFIHKEYNKTDVIKKNDVL